MSEKATMFGVLVLFVRLVNQTSILVIYAVELTTGRVTVPHHNVDDGIGQKNTLRFIIITFISNCWICA